MIGLVGAGAMGSALGSGWLEAGEDVVTCVAGRSDRTRALAAAAGLRPVASIADIVRADVVVSVVPPGDAHDVARAVGAAARAVGGRPLVLELNAISPTTVTEIAGTLDGLDLVDGSISGGPPGPGGRVRVYLSGPHADRVPANPRMDVVVLDGGLGAASALKMCTASIYKGTAALMMQAMVTAASHGVLPELLADVDRSGAGDVTTWPRQVALAATKSARYVDEMREIARTQASAGLPPELFEGMAAAFAHAAGSVLGHRAPETVGPSDTIDSVLAELVAPAADER